MKNMKELVLHIGTPKTGTSTLQHFLKNNSKRLGDKGVYYPDFSKDLDYIYNAWGGGDSIDGNFGWYTRADLKLVDKMQIIESKFESFNTVLCSSENMWGELDICQFLQYWIEKGFNVRVIVYLRRQADYIESIYREIVRLILGKISINDMIDINCKEYESVHNNLHYDRILNRFSKVIGRKNIIVRPYEKKQLFGQDIILDFLNVLGVDTGGGFVFPDKRYNPPMSNSCFELKRRMNGNTNNQKLMNDCFYDILMKCGVDREREHFVSMLSFEERKNFMMQFDEGNRRIARDYLGREDGILFYEKDSEENRADVVTTERLLDQFIDVFTLAALREQERWEITKTKENEIDKKFFSYSEQFNSLTETMERKIELLQQKIQSCIDANNHLQYQVAIKDEEIQQMKKSTCWRITKPIRVMGDLLHAHKKNK